MPLAEFHVESPILRDVLKRCPDAAVTFEDQYTYEGDVRFLFWAETEDFEAFESAMGDDETVTDPTVLVETPTRRLYRVALTEAGRESTTYSLKGELDIVLLDAKGTSNGWTVRMLFPSREAISEYYEACRDWGLSPEIRTKYSESAPDSTEGSGLTARQREALETAFEMGYFEVPREASLEETAEEMGISRQAASERIRRGLSSLLGREFRNSL